ncbi:hypothetical protein [Niallia sp. FSL M8-0099]|uniref:hypothetical protein n=1 Tax=Niallia sp. FSL M8-0099 TaxID=2954519 RepID=UPI0030F73C13
MKNKVSIELGLALDAAIKEFTKEGVLDVPKHFDKWVNECEALNDISTYELAKYIIEGYEYPSLTKEQAIDFFVKWMKKYNENIPYPTKNSSYRRGRRGTLEEIERKLIELGL